MKTVLDTLKKNAELVMIGNDFHPSDEVIYAVYAAIIHDEDGRDWLEDVMSSLGNEQVADFDLFQRALMKAAAREIEKEYENFMEWRISHAA